MVSFKLLVDLNEFPGSPISSSPISPTPVIATPSTNLIVPKIEPKAEPLAHWIPKLPSTSSTFPITGNSHTIFSQTVNRTSPAVSMTAAGAIVPGPVTTITNYPKAEPLRDWKPIAGNAPVGFSVNGSSPAVSAGVIVPATVATTAARKVGSKSKSLEEVWDPYMFTNPTLNVALADSRCPQATPSATPGITHFRFGEVPSWQLPEGAIILVPGAPPHKRQKKLHLIRFDQITTLEAFNSFIDSVRKTRILYESLRLSHIEKRSDLHASNLLRYHNLWLHPGKKIIGSVPGISIGDIFLYRIEMCVLGLHRQPQAGIDYLTAPEPVTTSIIISGAYEDDVDEGNTITYSGHGGRDKKFNRQCCDQILEGGNLALFNSWLFQIPVRVIRGLRRDSNGRKVYVYDGLYRITNAWPDVGKSGFKVYKFHLCRFTKQAEMGSRRMRLASSLRANPMSTPSAKGYLSLDLSLNKETVPVYLFNDIDSDTSPMQFEYLPRSVFPASVYQSPGGRSTGCACIGGCSFDCVCVAKNGGKSPYDKHGLLIRGRPVVFECGAGCRCPPDCRNRVSQRGLKRRLEVFKSKSGEWRVRSLEVIRAGSFICEYSGLVVDKEQARIFAMAGDRLTYPGQFAPKWAEWGDLSAVLPDRGAPSFPSLPPLDFAIDTSTLRNVASYIGHSRRPNLLAQFVMYDHNCLMFPRVMLFAMEAIPPMRELTMDYGSSNLAI